MASKKKKTVYTRQQTRKVFEAMLGWHMDDDFATDLIKWAKEEPIDLACAVMDVVTKFKGTDWTDKHESQKTVK